MKKIITLTSDFGVQSQGVGIMEGVALEINPEAYVIHLMHGLPNFNLFYAARTMETINYMPVGYHVCVVDPGVGTKRKPIIIETKRGDFLIGPDNGVLIPATRFLGGIKKIVEITNKKYMKHPVSPIFHGRDIFTPAAAYLSKEIKIEEFGNELKQEDLVKAPYEEATIKENEIQAKIISINKFGSLHLNIMYGVWDKFDVKNNNNVELNFNNKNIKVPFVTTFGDVGKGEGLIMKDDYGRIEIALNQDSFTERYGVKIGDDMVIVKK
ncbi:MAG: SAM-dependent chlorinase/fluorinase [Nanoarchaeota archaeon]|nr:SAM-dependent chlorinase/fluorinase [Nanoarchaeota archaeon]